MSFKLRDYQQEAVDTVIIHIKKSSSSCLIKLPTGSGKSLVVAELAKVINQISNKKVLCLAPSKELIEQNAERYRQTGNPCSLFSASVGKKDTTQPVVFGSPVSVLNEIKKSSRFDATFGAIVIDEADQTTPTMRNIIIEMKKHNPNIRIIGMTATPYRLQDGYIYSSHYKTGIEDNVYSGSNLMRRPLFDTLLYELPEWHLIDNGYLARPVFGEDLSHYDTSNLKLKANGRFDEKEVAKAFTGRGRLTSEIVADVVQKSVNRMGVMFFSASIQHANEIMESLPYSNSAIVTGKTEKVEREAILAKFKSGEIKYIVNISVLTVGFDAPNAEVIAILRATESARLLIQIVGRGLRLHDDKENCLVLDYAENLERHAPSGDIFNPEIKGGTGDPGEKMEVLCPECEHPNQFSPNPDYIDVPCDAYGYVLTPDGLRLKDPDNEKYATNHLGHRCKGAIINRHGIEQCNHRWNFKECEHCQAENSITARYCIKCHEELIDPNEKLNLTTWAAVSKNPDEWIDVTCSHVFINKISSTGTYRIDFSIFNDYGKFSISDFINPVHKEVNFKRKSTKMIESLVTGSDTAESLTRKITDVERVKALYITIGKPLKYRKQGKFYEIKITNPQ